MRFFFKNPALLLFYVYDPLTSCKKAKKSNVPFSLTFRTDGHTDGLLHIMNSSSTEVENCSVLKHISQLQHYFHYFHFTTFTTFTTCHYYLSLVITTCHYYLSLLTCHYYLLVTTTCHYHLSLLLVTTSRGKPVQEWAKTWTKLISILYFHIKQIRIFRSFFNEKRPKKAHKKGQNMQKKGNFENIFSIFEISFKIRIERYIIP